MYTIFVVHDFRVCIKETCFLYSCSTQKTRTLILTDMNKGVTRIPERYRARVKFLGKYVIIGYYQTEEAARLRVASAEKFAVALEGVARKEFDRFINITPDEVSVLKRDANLLVKAEKDISVQCISENACESFDLKKHRHLPIKEVPKDCDIFESSYTEDEPNFLFWKNKGTGKYSFKTVYD